jgi:hypothetical protein
MSAFNCTGKHRKIVVNFPTSILWNCINPFSNCPCCCYPLWSPVNWEVDTNVSEKYTASNFRFDELQMETLFLQNVGMYPLSGNVSQLRSPLTCSPQRESQSSLTKVVPCVQTYVQIRRRETDIRRYFNWRFAGIRTHLHTPHTSQLTVPLSALYCFWNFHSVLTCTQIY